MPLRKLLGLSISLTLLTPACGSEDPGETVIVTEADLPCSGINEVGIWESVPLPPPPPPDQTCEESAPPAPDGCEWFEYRARTTYQFSHSLGRVPREFLGYMSFSSTGCSSGLPGGDTLLLEAATEDYVMVRNTTNQRFYLRLVLE